MGNEHVIPELIQKMRKIKKKIAFLKFGEQVMKFVHLYI